VGGINFFFNLFKEEHNSVHSAPVYFEWDDTGFSRTDIGEKKGLASDEQEGCSNR
jgi:hypothetical protein